jgi:transposase, IS6 family
MTKMILCGLEVRRLAHGGNGTVERPFGVGHRSGTVALADPWEAGDWSGDCAWHGLGLCWCPVPAGGDRGRGPLVPALWTVLPGRRSCWPSAESPSITSLSTGGSRGSPPEFIEAASHAPGDRWLVDETYLKVAGKWTCLYWAVDQHGQVIDVLLSASRDLAATRHFFTRALRTGTIPAEVTTDRAAVYPQVLDELIPSALHTVEQYANNPIEADHGRLKARLRPMRDLKRHRSARILAAGHAFVQKLRRGHYDIATDVPDHHWSLASPRASRSTSATHRRWPGDCWTPQ